MDDLVSRAAVDLGDTPERVPIHECGEPFVALTEGDQIIARPIWLTEDDIEARKYQEYVAKYPDYKTIYVRKSVDDKLQQASQLLPEDWCLTVKAGHRPIAVQQAVYDEYEKEIRLDRPELDDDQLAVETRRFVSDPRRKDSPHTCGSAVDVVVLDADGELINFGSPINEVSDRSKALSEDLPAEAKSHRRVLLLAMLEAGFAPLESEWWHFSYGDQNWAAFYGEDRAIYSAQEVNPLTLG